MTAREPVVTVALDPDWASGALVEDVRRGLGSQPRTLYDLFEVRGMLETEAARLAALRGTPADFILIKRRYEEMTAADAQDLDPAARAKLGWNTHQQERHRDAGDEDVLRGVDAQEVAGAKRAQWPVEARPEQHKPASPGNWA